MKSDIEYYYNLQIDEFTDLNNYYMFKVNGTEYFFVLLERPVEDLPDIYRIISELKSKNINVHDIIPNKNNQLITKIDDINYILLRINTKMDEEVLLTDIINFQNHSIVSLDQSKLYRNNWASLWSDKVDYFEYQIHEVGKEKNTILNTFSYYIGLAENAISYVNNANEKLSPNYNLSLSHKRIYFPNYALNFYNPLSFIIDLKIRDIAEYLKSLFFKKQNALEKLTDYLKKNRLSSYEYSMLYARLLYPSYYFDIYERVMDHNASEDDLLPIIDMSSDYEVFLNSAYLVICRYYKIEPIEWIRKKEVRPL